MTHKPSKKAAARKHFLQCVCYRCNLLRWMFFVPCDKLKDVNFFKKIVITVRLFQPTYCCFLLTSVLKEVPILWYLHNNSAVLILMLKLISKIKLSYYTYTCLKNFRSWLFYENNFYTFYFLTFPHFFL